MSMVEAMKGTATPLASMFPAEDAHKAANRVQEKIHQNQQELLKLRSFAADNSSLLNLVGRLPDELHHDIMVPFGKAAFFPGRLVHTNEFLVLLGEGYYAERTSRQTVEILKRRWKSLDAQMDSIKATMRDLEAEVLFFNSTATEAAEGIVDIAEYEEDSTERASESGEEPDSPSNSNTDSKKDAVDEEEDYARLWAKMEELEKEELAEECGRENDEDAEAESDQFPDQNSMDSVRFSQGGELGKPELKSKAEHTNTMELMNKDDRQQLSTDQLNLEGLTVQSLPRDANLHEKSLSRNSKKSSPEKVVIPPDAEEEKVPVVLSSKNEAAGKTTRPINDTSKAFTGSIVERTTGLQTNPRQQSTGSSQPGSQTSKPVSRFKMQRR